MLNFDHYNPTQLIFGKDTYNRLPELIRKHTDSSKILLIYGGGSIKTNGIYERVLTELKDFEICEFGGIEANPEYATCMKCVDYIRENSIQFILAIGGGSVIDAVKFIAGASLFQGDCWDVLDKKNGAVFSEALPFGTVLTLPATGSEANSGAVISNSQLQEKRTNGGPLFFPKFSFLDPTVVFSLPKRQIANGIVDAFTHTTEQYITYKSGNILQEYQAEALLKTLIEIGAKIIENPKDYELAANFMWCATNALNGHLRLGVPTDWASHMIGHEFTALHKIDHARTLAIVGPHLWKHQFEHKKDKLAQYGARVWGLTGNKDEIALAAINKTSEFFKSLGMPLTLSELGIEKDDTALIVEQRFIDRGWMGIGESQKITPENCAEIVEACW